MLAPYDLHSPIACLFLDILGSRQDCLYVFFSQISDVPVMLIGENLESVLIEHSCDWNDTVIEFAAESFLGHNSYLNALSDPSERLGSTLIVPLTCL